MSRIIAVLLFGIAFLSFGCNRHQDKKNIERSFYYWKSAFSLTGFEDSRLESLLVKTIYLKYFDVDWDNLKAAPQTKAVLQIKESNVLRSKNIKTIPVVFITNECIQKIQLSQIDELSKNIIALIETIQKWYSQQPFIDELQIDCDWSPATKEKYFALLTAVKKSAVKKLSVTIRLHQVKYVGKTGVPPADRGLLMCYNMGNLKNFDTKNSILDPEELDKYVLNLSKYPLPLDVGLPLFNWYVLFRNKKYVGLIKLINTGAANIKKDGYNHFQFLMDTIISNIAFKKDDVLRFEESSYTDILKAAATISSHLQTTNLRVALFHLDSITLSKYTLNEMDNMYNSIH